MYAIGLVSSQQTGRVSCAQASESMESVEHDGVEDI